jgi:tRNA threonylcarbamoyladenosine biosynthesis protein TsaE
MKYVIDTIDDIAKSVIASVTSKTILVYGDMGSGKTTLIKSLVKQLGSLDEVSSPTYSLVNEYEIKNDLIYHFDLYRVKDMEEAYNFGIEDYLYSGHWVIIEWPQVIESIIPDGFNRIDLTINDNKSRNIALNLKTNFNKQIV